MTSSLASLLAHPSRWTRAHYVVFFALLGAYVLVVDYRHIQESQTARDQRQEPYEHERAVRNNNNNNNNNNSHDADTLSSLSTASSDNAAAAAVTPTSTSTPPPPPPPPPPPATTTSSSTSRAPVQPPSPPSPLDLGASVSSLALGSPTDRLRVVRECVPPELHAADLCQTYFRRAAPAETLADTGTHTRVDAAAVFDGTGMTLDDLRFLQDNITASLLDPRATPGVVAGDPTVHSFSSLWGSPCKRARGNEWTDFLEVFRSNVQPIEYRSARSRDEPAPVFDADDAAHIGPHRGGAHTPRTLDDQRRSTPRKRILWLAQHDQCLNKWFDDARADIITKTYRRRCPYAGHVYSPGSSWSQGRNMLVMLALQQERMQGWRYDYWILIDGDIRVNEVHVPQGPDALARMAPDERARAERPAHEQIFNYYDFLERSAPALAFAGYPWPWSKVDVRTAMHRHLKRTGGARTFSYADPAYDWPIYHWDACFTAVNRRVALSLLPYDAAFDHYTWWASQVTLIQRASVRYRGLVRLYGLFWVDNVDHAKYPKTRGKTKCFPFGPIRVREECMHRATNGACRRGGSVPGSSTSDGARLPICFDDGAYIRNDQCSPALDGMWWPKVLTPEERARNVSSVAFHGRPASERAGADTSCCSPVVAEHETEDDVRAFEPYGFYNLPNARDYQ